MNKLISIVLIIIVLIIILMLLQFVLFSINPNEFIQNENIIDSIN